MAYSHTIAARSSLSLIGRRSRRFIKLYLIFPMGCSAFSKLKPTSPTPVSHQGVEIKDSQLVISTRDVRLIVDGNEIGIGVTKCVGRACNRACWTVYICPVLSQQVVGGERLSFDRLDIRNVMAWLRPFYFDYRFIIFEVDSARQSARQDFSSSSIALTAKVSCPR